MTKLVSVIMPTYNCAAYIAESIRSVVSQTYTNWELIIADDASTDNTEEVLEEFKDFPNIKYIKFSENKGPAEARNACLDAAKGEYIAFLDSDDIWFPEKLERQIGFMEKNGYDFTCTDCIVAAEDGTSLNMTIKAPKKVGYNKMLFLNNPICNSTVIYTAAAYGDKRVPDIRKRNDFALWLQILSDGGSCSGFNEVLMVLRKRNGSVTQNKFSLPKYNWQLYREVERLSVPVSVAAFVSWAVVKTLSVVGRKTNRTVPDVVLPDYTKALEKKKEAVGTAR